VTTYPVKDLEFLRGDPTLASLDGEERAKLSAIRRIGRDADFGVYLVDTTPPDGQRWAGTFTGDPPEAVFEDIPQPTIEERRARMVITPLQGILTLGEVEWGKVLTYRETATWGEKVIIDNAADWVRTSENIAFFGYLLDYTDEDMDALFTQAAQVTV